MSETESFLRLVFWLMVWFGVLFAILYPPAAVLVVKETWANPGWSQPGPKALNGHGSILNDDRCNVAGIKICSE